MVRNLAMLYRSSYDFSGAIDNIYSSLVVHLAVSERFGRVRLWEDGAEFEQPGKASVLCINSAVIAARRI